MILEPGKRAGNYELGCAFGINEVSKLEIVSTEDRDNLTVYKTSNIWFFVNTDGSRLEQVTIFHPCDGKVLGKVGVGDTLQDVIDNFGKCVINHKVHEPMDFPGVAFEMVDGSKAKSAKIESISISLPYVFSGELPEHIKRNVNQKRKLP